MGPLLDAADGADTKSVLLGVILFAIAIDRALGYLIKWRAANKNKETRITMKRESDAHIEAMAGLMRGIVEAQKDLMRGIEKTQDGVSSVSDTANRVEKNTIVILDRSRKNP